MEKKNNIFDTSNILDLILKYSKTFIVIGVVSVIFSIFLYLVISPRYKSSIVLFPANSGSVSQALVADNSLKNDILRFGEQEEVEQLLQILVSSDIRNRLIEKFNLFEHYGIDRNSKRANFNLYKNYMSNVQVSKTKYMSIEVEVSDCDPVFAANLANSYIRFADSAIGRIQRERATKAYEIIKKEFDYQKSKIQQITDSLKHLGELGVINVESQSDKFSEQYAIALASGNTRGVSEIEQRLEPLAKYGSEHIFLVGQLRDEVRRLGVIEAKYREALIDLDNDLPKVFVVNEAEVSDHPFYPKLLPLLIINFISFFILSLFFIAFYEKIKKQRKIS